MFTGDITFDTTSWTTRYRPTISKAGLKLTGKMFVDLNALGSGISRRMALTLVSKNTDFCIKPCQYQMGLTPSTSRP